MRRGLRVFPSSVIAHGKKCPWSLAPSRVGVTSCGLKNKCVRGQKCLNTSSNAFFHRDMKQNFDRRERERIRYLGFDRWNEKKVERKERKRKSGASARKKIFSGGSEREREKKEMNGFSSSAARLDSLSISLKAALRRVRSKYSKSGR